MFVNLVLRILLYFAGLTGLFVMCLNALLIVHDVVFYC